MSIAAGRAAGEAAAAPVAAVAPEGPVEEIYRSAAAAIAHDWDDYLFIWDDYLFTGHTGHSAAPAAAVFAADPESALLAQVAANEVAGRLGAALFLGPGPAVVRVLAADRDLRRFFARFLRERLAGGSGDRGIDGLDTERLRMTFPSRLRIGLAGGSSRVVEGDEPGSCGHPLAEQRDVVEERLAVAGIAVGPAA
jgi:hypothetical protein